MSSRPAEGETAVPEYSRLFRWEREACLKRFRFHLQQGVATRPVKPQIAWDRAVYLGYRGGYQRSVIPLLAVMVPLVIVALQFKGSLAMEIFNTLFLVVPLLWFIAMVARIQQAKRRHPDYRHYKLDPALSDWDFTLTGTR